jgi:hypothetical protein
MHHQEFIETLHDYSAEMNADDGSPNKARINRQRKAVKILAAAAGIELTAEEVDYIILF